MIPTVLKQLICKNECLCKTKINFRGLSFDEYKALQKHRKMQICFYDKHGNFKITTKKMN